MRSWNGSVVFPAMQWHYRCCRYWVTELKANKFQILLEILFPLMSPGSPLPVTYRHRKQLEKDFFQVSCTCGRWERCHSNPCIPAVHLAHIHHLTQNTYLIWPCGSNFLSAMGCWYCRTPMNSSCSYVFLFPRSLLCYAWSHLRGFSFPFHISYVIIGSITENITLKHKLFAISSLEVIARTTVCGGVWLV